MAKSKPAKMLAILGRCRRTGRWRIGTRSSVLALLGSCRLDMRSSFVEDDADQMKMAVTVLLGSAVFILPDGAEVRPSGMSLLSAELVDVPEHREPSGLPILEIEWTCVLGRVQVVTSSTLAKLATDAEPAGWRGGRRRKTERRSVTDRTAPASPAGPDCSAPAPPGEAGPTHDLGLGSVDHDDALEPAEPASTSV